MKSLVYILLATLVFGCTSNKNNTANNDAENVPVSAKENTTTDTVQSGPGDSIPVITAAELISPGKQIGSVILGQKTSEVIELLGRPDFGDAAMGKSVAGWYSKSDPAHQTKVYSIADYGKENAVPRIRQVRVNSPYFKTKDGIHAGSTVAEIRKIFHLEKVMEYPQQAATETIKVMDDNKNGITFEIGGDSICRGITVHEPGKELFNYLQFYGN